MITPDLFFDFLTRENIVPQYFRNLNEVFVKDFNHFVASQEPFNWLRCAFNWENTSEGHEYWKQLNDEWSVIIKFICE